MFRAFLHVFCSHFYETEEKITTYSFGDTGKLLVKNNNGSITISAHQHNTIILKEVIHGWLKSHRFTLRIRTFIDFGCIHGFLLH